MNQVTRETPLSELVRSRRATDNFSPEPVPDSDLEQILQAGLEAPSSYNLQPWRFVVVRDVDQRKKLRGAALNQQKVEDAPVVVVACGDTLGWRQDLEEVIRLGREHGIGGEAWAQRKQKNVIADLGSHPNISMWVAKQTMIAATTMMWMAEALGYDTGPMEGFDEEEVRTMLGIPTHVRVLFLLAIGHLRGRWQVSWSAIAFSHCLRRTLRPAIPFYEMTRFRKDHMSNDEQSIRTWLNDWLRASAKGDAETMLTMLTDDMVFLVPGQPPFGKNEFKAAWDSPMKGARIESNADLEECIVSGNVACTRTRLTVAITAQDGQVSRASGYTLSFFRKQPDGRWLLARDANLLTPEM
jgi:uncharacterized protein (TIGR02246 family)